MEKIKYECSNCQYVVPKWLGYCLKCSSWNSFVEKKKNAKKRKNKLEPLAYKKLIEIESKNLERILIGISEFDRVLGGGLTQGAMTLIGGEPGVGKSTLLLEALSKIANSNSLKNFLYISGEESEEQISLRAKRLKVKEKNLFITYESKWEKIRLVLDELDPFVFILDSIQTTVSEELPRAAGTISQIREITHEILNYCKDKKVCCFIIGHITKDGTISGPKVLEHMVDTVLYFEKFGDGNQRILRSIKNRFGNTFEVGIFEIREDGLIGALNISANFIGSKKTKSPGRSISCILEGKRAFLVEVQALVNENKFLNPKRVTLGIDQNRLSMLVAIIEKYFEISLTNQDIFINLVGGLKVSNKEIDLAIIVSILSSYYKKPLSENIVFLGEVGLSGEVREEKNLDLKLKEIVLYGHEEIFVGRMTKEKPRQKLDFKISVLEKINDLKKIFH